MPLPAAIQDDLTHLVKLASSVTGAHTVAIFLPTHLVDPRFQNEPSKRRDGGKVDTRDAITLNQVIESGKDTKPGSIDLVAAQSYSKVARDARIQAGTGLLGWVANHGRPISLSPCDRSNLPAIYVGSESIQSLVAVPIDCSDSDLSPQFSLHGVLLCDSLHANAFSNSDINFLEQIARQCQRLVFWAGYAASVNQLESSWDLFKQKVGQLGGAIGPESIDLLKLRIESFQDVADSSGLSEAVKCSEQFVRLVQQALPPHFPIVRIPSGEIVIAVDNMMSTFFQQKVHNLAMHTKPGQAPIVLELERYSAKLDTKGAFDIDHSFQQEPKYKKLSSIGGTRV